MSQLSNDRCKALRRRDLACRAASEHVLQSLGGLGLGSDLRFQPLVLYLRLCSPSRLALGFSLPMRRPCYQRHLGIRSGGLELVQLHIQDPRLSSQC